MNIENIEALAAETLRLIDVVTAELDQALNVPHFISEANPHENTINASEVRKWVDDLINENNKLTQLEIVVAVIGTMKSGKSTTINAIAGMDLLPNRETAMTTLPTLIRNKHGQAIPVLCLNKLEPLQNLYRAVAKAVKELDDSGYISDLNLHKKDGDTLLEMLLTSDQPHFKTEYIGQNEISEFLRHLNDLMRLAKDKRINFDVDSIYEAYGQSSEMPVIEVELDHLKGSREEAKGVISILDTPGPNEFGQSESLRRVFQSQLRKASAVFLIIDFTQMNTEADAAVRQQLESVKGFFSKDRLYVIVNKFDQANSRTMNSDQVKDFVMDHLLEPNLVDPNLIFPVSSFNAYLANRARHHMFTHDVLPSPQEEPWVRDFAKVAFGDGWEDDLDDLTPARLHKKIDSVWNKSQFENPLEMAVKAAHATAAEKSIDSAIQKLKECNREYLNTLNIYSNTLANDMDRIQTAMSSLRADIDHCVSVRNDVIKKTGTLISEIVRKLDMILKTRREDILKTIDYLFERGAVQQKSYNENLRNTLDSVTNENLRDLFSTLFSGGSYNRREKRVESKFQKMKIRISEANSGVMEFRDNENARRFVEETEEAIEELINEIDKEIEKGVNAKLCQSAEDIAGVVNENMRETLESAMKSLGDSGFEVVFHIQALAFDIDRVDFHSIYNKAINTKTCYETGRRHKKSLWGWLCSKVGTSDWGTETYQYQRTSYSIDLSEIKSSTLSYIDSLIQVFSNQSVDFINNHFQPQIDAKLDELGNYLQKYQGVIRNSLEIANLDQSEKSNLKQRLGEMIGQAKRHEGDISSVLSAISH